MSKWPQNLAVMMVITALTSLSCGKRTNTKGRLGSLDSNVIPFFVEGVLPKITSPGSEAVITGFMLGDNVEIQIDGAVADVKSRNDSEIIIIAPDDGSPGGVYNIAMSSEDLTRNIRLGVEKTADVPLYSGSLEQLCDDQTIVNADGDVVRGLRDCKPTFEQSPPVVIEAPEPVQQIPLCKFDGQSDCIVGADQVSVRRVSIAPELLVVGASIAGVVGTVPRIAAACERDGQVECTTTAEYPAVESGNFHSQNIRAGVTLGGIPGSQKFCKSGVNRNAHNTTGPSGSALDNDIYDTIDDQGAKMGEIDDSPFGEDYLCNGSNSWLPLASDASVGTALDCDSGADNCVFADTHSQIAWTEVMPGFFNWADGAERCKTLDWLGLASWRLPTQKEALQAYIDGIEQLSQTYGSFGLNGSAIWTATSLSAQTGSLNHNNAAWVVYLDKGISSQTTKTGNAKLRCIADIN